MTRRQILATVSGSLAALLGVRWTLKARAARDLGTDAESVSAEPGSADFERLVLPKSKWKELLADPSAYRVLFEEGTERAFSSPLNDEKHAGTFVCAACFLPLFGSEQKFDSGTGWPSFYDAKPGRLGTRTDYKLIIPRTEYHCARCDGHQGHVFNDGPKPTGLRYCNNGVALNFIPDGAPLPELRAG